MNTILIWMATVFCVMAESVNKEQNPYIEALRNSPLARQAIHGYLEIRPGAHMFYWFYYANGSKLGANRKPLLIWIQGGPGFAASGIGNFAEIGPLNMNFGPRNHTWVKGRNLLLLDHPVGTGFSYVINDSLLVRNDREMAIDLSRAIKMFYRRHKEFRKTPTYIFGQSYGGKICTRLGLYLYTAIKKKSLKMNLRGIGIGGGWVDPKESTLMQPDLLYHTGAIDRNLYLTTKQIAKQMSESIDKKDFETADVLDDLLFTTLNEQGFINFNNINTPSPYTDLEVLGQKINKYVKPTLSKVNQTLEWSYLSIRPYDNLKKSLIVPSLSFLETLLNKTKLKIVIYNGNLDIVTPLAGASNWVHKLNWHGAPNFAKAKRSKIRGNRNGFFKTWKQFSFWSVFGAGHWVPEDNPEAMEHILDYIMFEEIMFTDKVTSKN